MSRQLTLDNTLIDTVAQDYLLKETIDTAIAEGYVRITGSIARFIR